MLEINYNIKGRQARIHVIQFPEDLSPFVEWIKRHPVFAFDTETTGLKIYSEDFRLRLAQFGNQHEAWVIPVELGEEYAWHVKCALEFAKKVICHNAAFDIQVVSKCLGISLRGLFNKVEDTGIYSRLWDSRNSKDGGPGHKLEELVSALIDKEVALDVKQSMGRMARQSGLSKEELFQSIDLFNPDYLLYAGMDVILTSLVYLALKTRVPPQSCHLIPYETKIARICAEIERNGFLVDVGYTNGLIERLHQEETWWQLKIEEFTDDDEFSTSSTDAVANVLLDCGWDLFDFTNTGRLKVDDGLLRKAAESGIPFAQWIREAKKARKWRKTWPEGFISNMDAVFRCHASINPLAARTGRMSIGGSIPAQTLPKDPLIRNCFLADPGHLICSVDYKAQELRVTAALSGDKAMLRAFKEGLDLHQMTADAAGVSRATGKATNFLTVYGGGWKALMETAKVDEQTAKRVLAAFAKQYPGVAAKETGFADRTALEASEAGYVVTSYGRVLRVDRNRAYSATNYLIQSTSRDITASALIRLDEAGFTPYMRLPIHDEVLFSFPAEHAEYGARKSGEIMLHHLNGLEIPTDPEVGGRSWGSLYEKAA